METNLGYLFLFRIKGIDFIDCSLNINKSSPENATDNKMYSFNPNGCLSLSSIKHRHIVVRCYIFRNPFHVRSHLITTVPVDPSVSIIRRTDLDPTIPPPFTF
jgi:hypothetical protein